MQKSNFLLTISQFLVKQIVVDLLVHGDAFQQFIMPELARPSKCVWPLLLDFFDFFLPLCYSWTGEKGIHKE
jgi:hypothetical protein